MHQFVLQIHALSNDGSAPCIRYICINGVHSHDSIDKDSPVYYCYCHAMVLTLMMYCSVPRLKHVVVELLSCQSVYSCHRFSFPITYLSIRLDHFRIVQWPASQRS